MTGVQTCALPILPEEVEHIFMPFFTSAELTRDAGLVDWELLELMVCSGSGAIAEVAGLPADIMIVCLPGIPGQIAVTAAAQAGTGQIWWSCPAGKELRLPDGVRQVAGGELPGLLLAAR